jgi:hypothetical protein
MRVAMRNHQNKAAPLWAALESQGVECSDERFAADVLLIDTDFPVYDYRQIIDWHKERGAKIVIYPHGANPNVVWDGLYEPYAKTDAVLVPAEGHRDIMLKYGYPKPIYVCGWFLSEVRPMRQPSGRRVLFAPIHPDGHGLLGKLERYWNGFVWELLRTMDDIELSVRYLGTLEQNHLTIEPGITYRAGRYDGSTADIDTVDVVVASGTYAYMSLAKGVPTVGFMTSLDDEYPRLPDHWEQYCDDLAFPLDAGAGDMAGLIEQAFSLGDGHVFETWRKRMIGEPLDAPKLVAILQEIINQE